MSCNPNISKQWLKTKYWDEEKTDYEMAALRKVSIYHIQHLLDKFDLRKKSNGIKPKGKRGYVMPEQEKEKHRIQPHAKEIIAYKGKSKKKYQTFRSINHAAECLKIRREHIRDCLSSKKQRHTARGFKFEIKRYKGEIIIERRMNLDFTLEFERVTKGLLSELPDYPREERIAHYNRKLNLVWKKIGY